MGKSSRERSSTGLCGEVEQSAGERIQPGVVVLSQKSAENRVETGGAITSSVLAASAAGRRTVCFRCFSRPAATCIVSFGRRSGGLSASHTKDTYLATQYRRLAARRGKKRALIAVGHSILVIVYHVLKYHVQYQDLGADYFDRLEPERLRRYLVRRLQHLGYEVALTTTKSEQAAA